MFSKNWKNAELMLTALYYLHSFPCYKGGALTVSPDCGTPIPLILFVRGRIIDPCECESWCLLPNRKISLTTVLIREEVFTCNNKFAGMEPTRQLYNMTNVIILPPLSHIVQALSPCLTSPCSTSAIKAH